jgi:hypothetical protein
MELTDWMLYIPHALTRRRFYAPSPFILTLPNYVDLVNVPKEQNIIFNQANQSPWPGLLAGPRADIECFIYLILIRITFLI